MSSRRFLFNFPFAPGDTLVLTGFIRDLKLAYPEFEIGVHTAGMDFWRHNPYVKHYKDVKHGRDLRALQLDYGNGISRSKYEPVHFLTWLYHDFHRQTKLDVPMTVPRPDVHFGEAEQPRLLSGRYWVVIAGGKRDFTTKVWHTAGFQAVVDGLAANGITCVQAGGSDKDHWHPPLRGTLDMVGKTGLRDFMRLVRDADGVICGVTMAMHLAAGLERPCVVLGGGREAWWWEGYVRENKAFQEVKHKIRVPHRFLHTIGLMPECTDGGHEGGCWKNKVVALGHKDKSLCKFPLYVAGQPVPKCMTLITPNHVLEAVMSYYRDKTLPPVAVGANPQAIQGLTTNQPTNNGVDARVPSVVAPAPILEPAMVKGPPEAQDGDGGLQTAPEPLRIVGRLDGRPGGYKPALTEPRVGTEKTVTTNGVRKSVIPGRRGANALPLTAGQRAAIYNPIIGGKFTFFLLFHGDFAKMHRECLEHLVATVPAEHREIRLSSNALGRDSLDLVNWYERQGIIQKHYRHKETQQKYPSMREMFHDPAMPIKTNYIIWFDDDTICDKASDWLFRLSSIIVDHHPNGARLFGPLRIWQIKPEQEAWFRQASWYRKRDWRAKNGKSAPNGNWISFASGSLWALHTPLIAQADIPDVRLRHNGGDYTIGEQVWQAGFTMHSFSAQKQFVNWSKYKRRGLSEAHPRV